jgi:serine/threonine protein kinase
MGSVWHSTHLGLDVPCAVKFIEGEGAELPEVQARFEREAKAAAHLRSPHVVQILDHGVCDGTPYIAMELLDGEDLGKRLARLGRIAPHELLIIVVQVCRALTKAHSQGIVHRDLKPDNIFLVRDDDREITKVLDFGIAKATGSGAPGMSTRTGAMLGTPYYMSPEQAQGTKAVDARSDLWSLAVIVFEALTGQRPFESEALGDLLMRIIVAPIPLPSQFVRDLPPAIDAWWARASQRDPTRRFQSAKELGDGLTVAFGRSARELGEPVPSPPTSRVGSIPPPAYGVTPQPYPGASTGTPIAQTFGVGQARLRDRTPMFVALGGGVALVVAGIVGISFAMKARAVGSADEALTTTAASVMAAPDAMAFEPAAPAANHLEAASPAELVALPPEPKPPPAPTKPPAAKSPKPARPPAATAAEIPNPRTPVPQPAPTPEKKKPIDLGI